MVIHEEEPSEGIFDKEPAPSTSEIQNSTAPSYVPGEPVEAGAFKVSNWAEGIALVRDKGLEVDDDMGPTPDSIYLLDTPDSDTLLEGYTW